MRIYIESTIPSYVVARPARDLLQAARQQLTRDWWELKRHEHELFTSQIVLDEIGSGDATMAEQRLALVRGIPVARATDESEALTQRIVDSGVVPQRANRDAAHIALATVHAMDMLLTWNCRHCQRHYSGTATSARRRRGLHAPSDLHPRGNVGERQ